LDRKEVVGVVITIHRSRGEQSRSECDHNPYKLISVEGGCSQSIEEEEKSRVEVSVITMHPFWKEKRRDLHLLRGYPLSYLDRKEVVSVVINIHRGRGEHSRSGWDHNPYKKSRVEGRVFTNHRGRGEEQSRSQCDHYASFLEGEKKGSPPLKGMRCHLEE
jgi:hypothetical protein